MHRQKASVHGLGSEAAGQPRGLGTTGGLRLHQNQHEMERLGLQGQELLGMDPQCSL